jgi:DNA mismatch repair protein MutS
MGTRMMRTWIDRPLIDQARIEKRQDIVQVFLDHFFERADLTETLKGVYDIERLVSRVSFGKANPKDMLQLGATLGNVPAIKAVLEAIGAAELDELILGLDELPELFELIDASIDPNAPMTISDGGIIASGYNVQLDGYREVMKNGASWILDIETKERQATGITNLKIDYNKKDGYYFHVTNSQLDKIPDHFFRKATLKNSERFGTTELAKIEGDMLEAREQSAQLEYDLFMAVRAQVESYIHRLQSLAKVIATVDSLQALAIVAEKYRYVRPILEAGGRDIAIIEGRHAVVEAIMGAQEYVPNTITLDQDVNMQLITGPNMSGKSTYMRQLALTVVMAQLGSFVPAESARLPIFDAIFTRIGAADDLISGQSTFMVEMMEANHAVRRATRQSLILFDELGRGTATYDGMALAQSIIEYLHEHVGAKTLFATHYHELTALQDSLDHLVNVHVATHEDHGDVTFLHKIEAGPADKSYGIHVAKIAGLPQDLLDRADVILQKLEQKAPVVAEDAHVSEQLSLFNEPSQDDAIIEALREVDVMNLTPMAAMNLIFELKNKLK